MADITQTPSAVLKTATTISDRGIAGATILANQPVYKDTVDGNKIKLADADLSLAAAEVIGIALHGSLNGQPIEYATGGDVTMSGLTAGTSYVLSATAGGIAPDADLVAATTWYATEIGIATSTTNLKLKINPSRTINA